MKLEFRRGSLCFAFGVCALCVGLVALEIRSRNHQLALELHEQQRASSAAEAVNQRLRVRLRAHLPLPPAADAAEVSRP